MADIVDTNFKFRLGQIVRFDALDEGVTRSKGRVIARTEHLGGPNTYVVICNASFNDGISRHHVMEYEISAYDPYSDDDSR